MGEPLRVALAGLGDMGRIMAIGFDRDPAWELVAAADRDPGGRGFATELAPDALVVDDAGELLSAELLDRAGADLVAIATPPTTHPQLAIGALELGRHVLCEKPMAVSGSEAARMAAAAEAHPRQLALLDHQMRYSPSRRWLRDRLAAGDIGRPRHALVRVYVPHWADRQWDWWSVAERGGGVLNEGGSHVIDALQWIFGPAESATGELRATLPHRPGDPQRRAVSADDVASFRLRWNDGLFADVVVSCLARPREYTWEVHGDDGSLTVDIANRCLRIPADGEPQEIDLSEADPSLIDDPTDDWTQPFARLLSAIVDSIPGASPPADAATFAAGLDTTRMLDAIRAAARGE